MLRPSQHRRVNNDPTGTIARFRSPRYLPGGLPLDHRDNPGARHMTHIADSFDGTHHHTRHVKAPFLIAGLSASFKRPPNHASPRLHHRNHPPAANARPPIQQRLISGHNLESTSQCAANQATPSCHWHNQATATWVADVEDMHSPSSGSAENHHHRRQLMPDKPAHHRQPSQG